MSSNESVLKFKKLSKNAESPFKASSNSAGYDLSSATNTTVPSKGTTLVPTDLQLQIPEGCYGRIAPRSSLALKNSIDVGAGVIDSDFRGNIGILLFNFGSEDYKINQGDRIAQIICEKISYPILEEIKEEEELSATERGEKGFGSSGK